MWSLLSVEITLKRNSKTPIKGVCNNYNFVTKLKVVTTAVPIKCCFLGDNFYLCTPLRII